MSYGELTTEEEAEEAVEAGAGLFDAYFGNRDWRQKIDRSVFDINDWSFCPIGQLFEGVEFYEALKLIGAEDPWAYGFMGGTGDSPWIALQDAWLAELDR